MRGTERDLFDYYEIPTRRGEYLTVDVLGFVNAPGFETYRGPIRFQDSFRIWGRREERGELAVPPPAHGS